MIEIHSILCFLIVLCNSNSVFTINSLETIPQNDKNTTELKYEYKERVCNGKPICDMNHRPKNEFDPCMCDVDCNFFQDCCLDSPFYNATTQDIQKPNFVCPPVLSKYMVKSCPSSFANTTAKFLCENITDGEVNENPQVMKPVVDINGKIVYFNIYCAQCNNKSINDLESTKLNYECAQNFNRLLKISNQSEVKLILEHMYYNHERKRFVSNYSGMELICVPRISISDKLQPFMRPCKPNVISSCPIGHKNQTEVDKCKSFTSLAYESHIVDYGKIYKNEFCAACNGWKEDLEKCQIKLVPYSGGGASSLFASVSFGEGSIPCDTDDLVSKFC